jgi:hypothetical protein
MITKVPSFRTTKGEVFASLEEAQAAELLALLTPEQGNAPDTALIRMILLNQERVIDILTTAPSSLPKARKVNGGRKVRKAVKIGADANFTEAKANAVA